MHVEKQKKKTVSIHATPPSPLEELKKKQDQAHQGGGTARQAKQHANGKLTARERIALLLDEDSFEEIGMLAYSTHLPEAPYTDGVVTGFGTIDGRRVAVFSQDFTIRGGSLGKRHAEKICAVMDKAAQIGCPFVGILDSGGARIEEGIHALAGYGEIMKRNVCFSGIIPQISIIAGPCAGGAVYSPALTDFIFTTKEISHLFITGPQVIEEVLGQSISKEELGGSAPHSKKSGVVHFVSDTEAESFERARQLLSYLPNNYTEIPKLSPHTPPLGDITKLVPDNNNRAYDIKNLITALVDAGSFFEVQEQFAPNIVVGFACMAGATVCIVANQPLVKAGTIDIDASGKAARFIRFCDNFNIPILSLVDVPGFLPGVDQEHGGIIRHGAKLLYAYAHATVPKVSVVLRKAFGGAYIVMGSKHLGGDMNYAWPDAQIAVLGARSAITILHGRELAPLNDNEKKRRRDELEAQYAYTYLNPYIAAQSGYIDAVIEPAETRNHLLRALSILREKVEKLPAKRGGNIPL